MASAQPAEPMPPAGTPQWDAWAAQDKGPSILIICWVFNGLATLFVIGRLYVRIGMQKSLLSDDYWCIVGLICGYMSVAFTVIAVDNGNGKHWELLSDPQKEKVLLWTTCAFCPGVLCFGLPKMAVVSLLNRLLNPSLFHKWFLWGMAIWCQLTLFATIGTLLGRCTPAASIWNFAIKGTCVDQKHIVNFSIYAGAYSAFVDVYLAVYPAVILWQLQMRLKRKLALICALGIGTASAVVAIYKTTRIPQGLASPDFSYDSADLMIWTVVEGSTMIIACSIPVLSPLLDAILRGHNPFRSSRTPGSSYRDPNQFKNRDIEMGAFSQKTQKRQKLVGNADIDVTTAWDSQEHLHKKFEANSSVRGPRSDSLAWQEAPSYRQDDQKSGYTTAAEETIVPPDQIGVAHSMPSGHHIVMTNEVTVTYDRTSVIGPTSNTSWNPVRD